MWIAIEGPELGDADFDKILEMFGEQNWRLKFWAATDFKHL